MQMHRTSQMYRKPDWSPLFVPTALYIRPPPNYIHRWSVGPQKSVTHRSTSIAQRGTPEADILVRTERDRPAFHTNGRVTTTKGKIIKVPVVRTRVAYITYFNIPFAFSVCSAYNDGQLILVL